MISVICPECADEVRNVVRGRDGELQCLCTGCGCVFAIYTIADFEDYPDAVEQAEEWVSLIQDRDNPDFDR